MALGDVNGDRRLDIVTANRSSNTVGVLLGQADGTFAPVATYDSGVNGTPQGVVVGDVNGDGRPDIITANSRSSTVGVLLGQIGGTFRTVTTYGTGASSEPQSVALGDVNADGRPDIITANRNSNTVGVLLGQANGTFVTVTTYSAGDGSAPYSVALGDVNADGRPDIVTANYGNSTVGVLLGQDGGTFATVITYSTGASSYPFGLALGDMNADGRPDIVTPNLGLATVGVLLDQDGGIFAPVTNYSAANNQPVGVVVGDVNADGRPDVITVNYSSNTVGVLLNTSVAPPMPTLTSLSPTNGPVGTRLTLSGSNLTGTSSVRFNGTAATTFAVVNATTVTATVPTGVTSGNVTLTTPGDTSNGLNFTVVAARSVLATATALTAAEVTLFPNPTHAAFTVLVPAVAGTNQVQTTLFNALGQVVRQQTAALPANGARLTVETADLAAGVYTLRLLVGATTLAKRVVLQ